MSDTLTAEDKMRLGIESQALTIRDLRAIENDYRKTIASLRAQRDRAEAINAELVGVLEDAVSRNRCVEDADWWGRVYAAIATAKDIPDAHLTPD